MFRLTISIAITAMWVIQSMLAAPASAQTPKPIGSYGDWQALTYEENGKPVCYVFTEPAKKEGQYTSRGQVYALVTHRPADKKLNVFTIISGYAFKEDSDAILEIGDQKFTLFTQEGMAWANDEDDPKIVEALKKGTGMVGARHLHARHGDDRHLLAQGLQQGLRRHRRRLREAGVVD